MGFGSVWGVFSLERSSSEVCTFSNQLESPLSTGMFLTCWWALWCSSWLVLECRFNRYWKSSFGVESGSRNVFLGADPIAGPCRSVARPLPFSRWRSDPDSGVSRPADPRPDSGVGLAAGWSPESVPILTRQCGGFATVKGDVLVLRGCPIRWVTVRYRGESKPALPSASGGGVTRHPQMGSAR